MALLIFTNEIIIAASIKGKFEDSPVSTVFISGSPDLATNRKTAMIRLIPNLDNLGSDMILYIGEYLEFPHSTLGQLNRGFRQIFGTISPAKIISIQLEVNGLKDLQVSSDLKYLTSLSRSAFNDERLLTIIIDVALIKKLPNIKGSLLRLLYMKSLTTLTREKLLIPIQPVINSYSPISALISGFFEACDFEFLFDIFERFPELIIEDFIFTEELIESAKKLNKLMLIYQVYSRDPFKTFQNKFDFVCKCLSITFDKEILDLFLKEAYKPNEYWNENYQETYLNAWIFALTQSYRVIEVEGLSFDDLNVFNVHLAVRKQTLNLLLSIRVMKDKMITRRLLESFIIDFNYKNFYEEILWSLVVEKDYENFFYLLSYIDRLDSSKLRLTIAKSKDEEFLSRLFDGSFNVNALFSNNFYGEAVYNKRLFLTLTHHNSQEDFIKNSLLNIYLYKYAIEQFETFDDWNEFFKIKSEWSAVEFAEFFQFLLNNNVKSHVFDLMINLLKEQMLRIYIWERPVVLLNIKSAEFLLRNEYLLLHLDRFIKFDCEPTVMSHLITSNFGNGKLLKLLSFSINDLLIQLPHWTDHEKYRRIFSLTKKSYLIQLKAAISELKRLNSSLDFDKILLQIFNPILSKLKWESPVDYLCLLPQSILIKKYLNEPIYMRKAVDWAIENERVFELAFLFRGNVIKVKGPVNIERLKESLNLHKIRLIIE